ncbi:MAG: RNA-binding protein [Acidobacteria bacterium]|nr:RNA-binding protein [Acidobacteriota bacterium]
MSVNLYVGNLSITTTEQDLEEKFGQFGQVQSVRIVTDRNTGRSRGFAFVEMDSKKAAEAAIHTLNGRELDGRSLTVNEARPKEDRSSRSGFGGSRGGYGGGRQRSGSGGSRDRGSRW